MTGGRKRRQAELAVDFTEGPVFKQMLLFTVPLFLSNLMQIFYNMTDMMIVGWAEGKSGLAAVSVSGDITNCLATIMMGFATAVQVIVSHYLGSNQKEKIGKFLFAAVMFLLVVTALLSGGCLCLREHLLNWMNTPSEIRWEARVYLMISAGGLVFICGYNLMSAILRGMGDSKHPFLFVSAASIFNVVLDFLFVMILKCGAAGAAVATVISQAVSFFMAAAFLYRNRTGFAITSVDRRIDGNMLKILLRQGIPLALKSAAVQLTRLFTNSFIYSYGTIVCAASGVTGKLTSVNNMLSESLNTSGSSMISQNIGGKKYERVLRILWCMLLTTLPIAALLSICIICRPDLISGIFTNDPEVIEVCYLYIPMGVLAFFSSPIRSAMSALINGSGNYKVNFIVAILDAFVIRVGLGLYLGLGRDMGFAGFWLGDAIASYTPCVIGGILLFSGRWKENKYMLGDKE